MMDKGKRSGSADIRRALWALLVPEEPLAEGECHLSVEDDRFLFYWAGLDMLDSLLTTQERVFVEDHIQHCPSCQREHKIHERITLALPLTVLHSASVAEM